LLERKRFGINAFQRMLSDGRSPPMEPRFQHRKEQLLDACQVPPALFDGMIARLEEFAAPFAATFPSPESCSHTRTYLAGLLSDVERKNAESIAYRYDLDRQVIQRFIGEVDWDQLLASEQAKAQEWGQARTEIIAIMGPLMPRQLASLYPGPSTGF
jgi:hypothetical protein